jgi:hypothetical protein
MGVIALFAVEMALCQRVLPFVVMIPPVTIGFVSLNLAILYALKWLPRPVASRIDGMLCGGMIALFVLVGYYLLESPAQSSAWPMGMASAAISRSLASLAASRPDPSDPAATVLRLAAGHAHLAEIILLDLSGFAIIWAGGWIASRRHSAGSPTLASAKEHP